MLPVMQPRYYSISSSPKVDAARCSMTVGVVEGPARSGRGVYRGVCSNYLAGRAAGATVYAAVRETKAGFRLPEELRAQEAALRQTLGKLVKRGKVDCCVHWRPAADGAAELRKVA